MDGNSSWATRRDCCARGGHAGAEAVRKTLGRSRSWRRVLTLYALSEVAPLEEEMTGLKGLLAYYVDKELRHAREGVGSDDRR
jgi:hypothetical protein